MLLFFSTAVLLLSRFHSGCVDTGHIWLYENLAIGMLYILVAVFVMRRKDMLTFC